MLNSLRKFQRDWGGRNTELGFQKRLDKLNQNHRTQGNFHIMKEGGRIGDPKEAVSPLGQKPRRDDWRSGESLSVRSTVFRLLCILCVQIYILILQFFFLSLTPEIVSTPSSPEEEEKSLLNAVVLIDDSVPTTKIQIRLADGSRLIQRFNSTHR